MQRAQDQVVSEASQDRKPAGHSQLNLYKNQSSLKQISFRSQKFRRNILIFGILMIIIQAGVCITYGILFRAPVVQMNISSAIMMVLLALLIVAGFGLLFGYTVRLTWTSIGFNLLITALCLELYPLLNAFWTRVSIQNNATPELGFNNGDKLQDIFLTDREAAYSQPLTSTANPYYGNSLSNALKCALSVVVAFSAILGRASQLQCLLVTIVGVIGFELNRQLIQERQGSDSFGTMIIFAFGGFMGLGLGLLSKIRESGDNALGNDSLLRYRGKKTSVEKSAVGALIIFSTFPILAYLYDAYTEYSAFNQYTNAMLVVLAMGAGGVTSAAISSVANGYILVRDITHGIVAGAVSVGAASLYITDPIYGLLSGAIGGLFQGIIGSCIQTPKAREGSILSTVSWSLFGFQGILGAALSAAWKAVAFSENHALTVEPSVLNNFQSYREFLAGLIAAGMGLAFGLLGGVIVFIANCHSYDQYFEDFFYWMGSDGIRLVIHPQLPKDNTKAPPVSRPVIDVSEQPDHLQPMKDDPDYYDEDEEEVQIQISMPSEDDYEMGPAYL